jgi:putative hemolysin
LQAKTPKYVSLFQILENSPHQVLISILIANSVADVVAAALATTTTQRVFLHLGFSNSVGFSIGIGVASLAIIIFGEIVPKNIARSRGEHLFQSLLGLTSFMFYLLYPITSRLLWFTDKLTRYVGGAKMEPGSEWVSSEREVRFLIDYINQKGLIDPAKTMMLKNIFELGNTYVKEVMVPATDVIAIDSSMPISDIVSVFSQYHFTRLPVYERHFDNIIGMIHQKDLFYQLLYKETKSIKEIMRPIMFIPETVWVNQLLQEFRSQHMHIAIVLNEHGSVTGLVTLEDVIEEIVGEISDEHEATYQSIIMLPQGGWLISASTPLQVLSDYFGISFVTDESITLGGFLAEQLQHVPIKGEVVYYQGYDFHIQKTSPKRVRQVLVTKK